MSAFGIQYSFVPNLFSMTQCLCRTHSQLDRELPLCQAQMDNWSTNLQVMAAKERQYIQQSANYKVHSFFFFLRGEGVLLNLVL